ncbi:MAG: (d)CMP kinase [Myxococcota bacterium]
MLNRPIVVTIDGPAGAGKSSVARALAHALGYRLLDTGALYRTVTLLAHERGVAWDDEDGLARLCAGLSVEFHQVAGQQRVVADGRDVTEAIRRPEISVGASQVSAVPAVRAELLDLQRRLGAAGGVVVEGRDTGTVVFPRAEAKFFLTASAEVRARRRFEELVAAGAAVTYEDTLADQRERDRRDSERAIAPLIQAPDAEVVDSSKRSIDDVVAGMADIVRRRAQSRSDEER